MSVWKFFAVPASVLADSRITPAAKLIFGLLRYRQRDNGACWPGIESISRDLGGISRAAVLRGIGQLEKIGLIAVERRHKRTNTYTVSTIRDDTFLRIRLDLAAFPGLPAIDKLILASLDYLSSNDDGQAWIHQQTLADRLGCNRSTILRALDRLETQGHIKVDHRGGGRKRGNLYRISAVFFDSILQHGFAQNVANQGANDKEIKEIKKNNSPKGQSYADLSEKRRLLLSQGIAWPVADSLAADHALESIQNAILNAIGQQQLKYKSGRIVKIPAYVAGTLNKSRREGHGVPLNRFMAAEKAKFDLRTDPKCKARRQDPARQVTLQEKRDAAVRALKMQMQDLKLGVA